MRGFGETDPTADTDFFFLSDLRLSELSAKYGRRPNRNIPIQIGFLEVRKGSKYLLVLWMAHVDYRASDPELQCKGRAVRSGGRRKGGREGERRERGRTEGRRRRIPKCVRRPKDNLRSRRKKNTQVLLKIYHVTKIEPDALHTLYN